jgi:hypothetical protein
MYFAGALLLAMVRPATLFIFLSVLVLEILIFLRKQNFKSFLKGSFQKLLPMMLGYFISVFIQFLYSNSWSTYLDAQSHWEGKIGFPHRLSDWSIEGFGLSAFAICFVAIPVLIFTMYNALINRGFLSSLSNSFRFEIKNAENYVAMLSCIYLSGMFIFSLLTSGGSLHGFFRFVLCSPAFYALAIFVFDKCTLGKSGALIVSCVLSLALFAILLLVTEYGGTRWSYSYAGAYLLILNALTLAFWKKLNNSSKKIICIGLFLLNLVWNTYMFNIFLCDGWIFT